VLKRSQDPGPVEEKRDAPLWPRDAAGNGLGAALGYNDEAAHART
jgi:hypothetical protein